MKTQCPQLFLTLIGTLFFCINGYTQITVKDTITEKIELLGNSKQDYNEVLNNAKSFTMDSCISKLEENEVIALMDTITSIIHVGLYCLCSDYMTDVHVKLSNKERTYERVTDNSGCDFRHIQPGNYLLEVDYDSVQKFKPIEVLIMGGAKLRWKIFLCKEE